MNKTNLNELYTEEGFDVLDFNTFSLLESHGVLSGENSCSKFASHLLDFIEELNKKGIEFGEFIVHSNENCPHHQEYIDKGIPDLSTDGWDLPAWASWEFMVHIGVLEDDGNTQGELKVVKDGLEAHIGLQSPKEICRYKRIETSANIQHEMKHYFDYVIEFNKKGKINYKASQEIQKLFKKNDEMKKIGEDEDGVISFFIYFLYMTSETEMSAWLEQSRSNGHINRLDSLEHRPHDTRGYIDRNYSTYKKLLEYILLWKEDKSQYDRISHFGGRKFLPDYIKTYDEFKKFMMENFGSYLELRFGKKESFEKYIKRYIKILDKQIKKHSKIWADGFNGIDLNETPEDIEKMLIKKREERLERIRKKKEGKN